MVGGDETGSVADHSVSISASPGDDELRWPMVLVDRYQIERRLGSGGMGVVYGARDIHLGRQVAIKIVGSRGELGSRQDRLAGEARAMAKLHHPNIAVVHDIGICDGRLFVVMELVGGGTVADWLKARPRSWRDIVAVYLQAARGLAAAHAAGFVHRDFKPTNVLVGNDGIARVTDFGVARLLGDGSRVTDARDEAQRGDETGNGTVVGTPGYIAPEILRGEPEDERADQFSLCVAMYSALYGERPFEPLGGPDRTAETLGSLRSRPRIRPRWLSRVLVRGLASRPRDRWPTIAALVVDIEQHLGRRRRTVVVVGAGLVALAAATVVALGRGKPAPPPLWSPVALGRTADDAPMEMTVSPDGSMVLTATPTEVWVGPRVGDGTRRQVMVPVESGAYGLKLSRSGERIFYIAAPEPTPEIWSIDVATGRTERRVPSVATPAITTDGSYAVGPEGEVLFVGADDRTAWRASLDGAVRHVMTAEPGAWLNGLAWSRDGTRIAFMVESPTDRRIEILTLATGAVTITPTDCSSVEWLTNRSLLCFPASFRRPRFTELVLAPDGASVTERVRYDGPEFQGLDSVYTSSAGVLFSTRPFEFHIKLFALDAPETSRPVLSGGITDLPPAGWTPSGALIFGTSVQGQLRVMRRRPGGTIETVRVGPAAEVPLLVIGETIIFGRFPGGESTIPFIEPPVGRRFPDGELFRLAPDGAVTPLGKTTGLVGITCAGSRASPCLLLERFGDDVVAVSWEPQSGARGPEQARWNGKQYSGRGSLSPDGRTLAQVQRYLGTGAMFLLDLASGVRRRIHPPEMSFLFPAWQPDGTLLATAVVADGRVSIVRVRDDDTTQEVAVIVPAKVASFANEFSLSDDGKTAAVLTTDTRTTFWWAGDALD